MTTLPQRFGRAVRKLRQAAEFSQERFAYAAKIDRRYYTRIERGEANVSLRVIGRIAKGLKLTLPELFRAVERE